MEPPLIERPASESRLHYFIRCYTLSALSYGDLYLNKWNDCIVNEMNRIAGFMALRKNSEV